MGLDGFKSDDDGNGSDSSSDTDNEPEEVDGFPTKEAMARVMLKHARSNAIDAEVNNGTITGDAEELAMAFALMFMEYPKAQPYSLEGPKQ